MDFFKSLLELFCCKSNLLIQIALFSLTGIQALCFNAYVSYNLGSFYSAYLGYPPKEEFALLLMSILGVMITIFMFSYGLKYSNKILNSETTEMPNISLDVFVLFLKFMPLIVIWGIYFYFASWLGLYILNADSILFYFYYFLLLLFLPFVSINFIKFSKDFIYRKELFSLFYICSNIDKYSRRIWGLILKNLLIFVIAFTVICLIFYYSDKFVNPSFMLSTRLCALSLMFYLFNIMYMMYVNGVSKILKKMM